LLLKAVLVLVGFEVLLPVLLYAARDRLLFFPDASPRARDALGAVGAGVAASVVEVVRPDGRRLQSYDARPSGAPDGGPVVLFLHGNAGNLANRASLLGDFVRGTGARTLMVDYSGFGGNEGSPTEREVGIDGRAAFDHLVAAGVPAGRIVIYGESIGGAVAADVAADRECAGVVLQSTFSSASSMALRLYPWLPLAALYTRGVFPTARRLERIKAPLLVVHGDRDEIIPFAEGERLHRIAGARSEFLAVPGAHHNDFMDVAGRPYLAGLGERFRRWTAK
jgi:fermentation-respiration switch protein FrsA (DUF1100 family)